MCISQFTTKLYENKCLFIPKEEIRDRTDHVLCVHIVFSCFFSSFSESIYSRCVRNAQFPSHWSLSPIIADKHSSGNFYLNFSFWAQIHNPGRLINMRRRVHKQKQTKHCFILWSLSSYFSLLCFIYAFSTSSNPYTHPSQNPFQPHQAK